MTWRSDSARQHRRAGFTLVEMLVVLAVVGLALGIVASRGPLGTRTLSARAAANDLAAGFRETRVEAILTNRVTALVIDLASSAWQAGTAQSRAFPPELAVTAVTVADGVAEPREARFHFYPDGSSTGGRVLLQDSHRTLQVGVDWPSGRVSVADAP